MEEFPVEGTNTVSEPPKASNYRVEKDAWEKKTPRLNKNLVYAIYIFLSALFWLKVLFYYF